MRQAAVLIWAAIAAAIPAYGQVGSGLLEGLPRPHDYVLKRSSSYDRTGGNADYRRIAPGETFHPMASEYE